MADVESLWLESIEVRDQAPGVAARALRDNPASVAISDDPLVRLDLLRHIQRDPARRPSACWRSARGVRAGRGRLLAPREVRELDLAASGSQPRRARC